MDAWTVEERTAMHNDWSDCLAVLSHYFGEFRSEQIELRGSAGGFSGANIWRVNAPDRVLCLKRWPGESPTEDGMRFVHRVLVHVANLGFDLVPAPYEDRLGRTVIRYQGRLWDLAPWMPGKADFWQNPSPSRLEAALKALAEFHRAAATFSDYAPRTGKSPGMHRRLQRVRRYAAGDLERLCRCVLPEVWPEFCDRARDAVISVRRELAPLEILLETASIWEVPLQPCIRDVWHDHVLLTGHGVTGLVDFGAMAVESVAGDVARLLGSLVRDTPSLWRTGLEAYESIRPLQDREKALVEVFDRSGTILAALKWIEWLYRDRRRFPNPTAVANRLNEALLRLDYLQRGGSAGGCAMAGGLWLSPNDG